MPDVSSGRFGSALRLQMTALAALLGNVPAPVTDAQSEAVPVPGGAHGEAALTAGGGSAAGVALTAGDGDVGEAVVTAGGSAAAGVLPGASDSDMGEAAGPSSSGAPAGGVTATGGSGAPGRPAATAPAEDVILGTKPGTGGARPPSTACACTSRPCGVRSRPPRCAGRSVNGRGRAPARVPGLRDQSEDTRLRVARWLRDLYPLPAERSEPAGAEALPLPYWGSLQPDLLAEHLVAAVVAATPDLLPALLEETSPEQDHQALAVLTRGAATRPTLSRSLAELLAKLPGIAPTAVRVATQSEYPGPLLAALTALVERADVTSDRLAAISEAIPEQTQVLARFAVGIGLRLVADRERLAQASPDAYLPDLASSLNNLSVRLGEAGRRAEGLAAIERAVVISGDLVARYPQAFEPDLARVLADLGDQREATGDPVGAVEPLLRAVALAERNARQDLGDWARDVLRRARERDPAAVEAEYERLAGEPWPK